MFDFPSLREIAFMLPAVVLGLTFHEYAHGWMAYRLGDKTAYHMGRLTINPAAHVDPIGLLMLFFAGFGWAKPVPVNPNNLQGDVKQGMLLVSLAGPVTNLLLAIAGSLLLGIGAWKLPYGNEILGIFIQLNIVLFIFNLLPIPPLDGSKILAGLLPGRQEWLYQMEQYGTIILLILLFTGVLGRVLGFIIRPIYSMLFDLARAISIIVS